MTKKLTLKQIVDARRAISNSLNDKMGFKLAYKIAQFVNATQVDAEFWDAQFKEISKDCADEEGKIDIEKLSAHTQELEDLASQERDVECAITTEDLEKIEITPLALMAIMPVLAE